MSNCSPSHPRIGSQSVHQDSEFVGRVGGAWFAFRFGSSGLCILLQFRFKTSSSSAFGLAHCNVGVCGMHIHLTSWVGIHQRSSSGSGDIHVLSVKKGILASLPMRSCGNIEQKSVFGMLCDRCFDM